MTNIIVHRFSKVFINQCVANSLFLVNCAIATTKVPLAQQLLHQEQAIPEDNRKNLLELRTFLFQKSIKEKRDEVKEFCKKLVREKGIDINNPIYSMTLLQEAILRRFEDAAEILINDLGASVKKSDPAQAGLGKQHGRSLSLLHLATYNPDIMEMFLKRYEDGAKEDQEIFYLYKKTRLLDHPSKSYASARIVKALLDAGLESEKHESDREEDNKISKKKGRTPYSAVEALVLGKEGSDTFRAEYKKIGTLFGYPPERPPNVFPYTTSPESTAEIIHIMNMGGGRR
jgi:hypothetical protein